MIPLNEKLNKLSDEILLNKYEARPREFNEFDFYPVFALRILKFKSKLFEAAVSKQNINTSFFNFIRNSWLPVIAVLEYCNIEEIKMELNPLIKSAWDTEDYENFKSYLRTGSDFLIYFK